MIIMDLLENYSSKCFYGFSKMEMQILDANLFTKLCDELLNYFVLGKLEQQKELEMIDTRLARCVVNDILSSGDYTITGIACYTRAPEDVVYDIAAGRNPDPSSSLFRRIIKLHRTVRPELYQKIMKKLVTENAQDE